MKKIQYWQFIKMDKRMELRKEYGVKNSHRMSVENNRIVIDGICEEDLEPIPLEVLQEASGKIISDVKPKKDVKKTEEKTA